MPKQTIVPWSANKLWFLLDEIKLKSLSIIIIKETIKQIKPANETVVNFGVSFFHLKITEKIENPMADTIPKINPNNVLN